MRRWLLIPLRSVDVVDGVDGIGGVVGGGVVVGGVIELLLLQSHLIS